MPLLPNIEALIAETQWCYADALDLTGVCVDAHVHGIDTGRLATGRRRLEHHPRHALVRTAALLAGFLAAAAIDLAEQTGSSPDEIVGEWRRQAAVSINQAEAQLTGESL
jgi:hypothetical protein